MNYQTLFIFISLFTFTLATEYDQIEFEYSMNGSFYTQADSGYVGGCNVNIKLRNSYDSSVFKQVGSVQLNANGDDFSVSVNNITYDQLDREEFFKTSIDAHYGVTMNNEPSLRSQQFYSSLPTICETKKVSQGTLTDTFDLNYVTEDISSSCGLYQMFKSGNEVGNAVNMHLEMNPTKTLGQFRLEHQKAPIEVQKKDEDDSKSIIMI